ncbi:Nrap-domain-containing protein [Testicularia cyperi]|uniref:Nrap-domain-containing protein n=1 Tax=Testicularia cyperi TaxID=1882483 RepID=A0A317XSM4_9BASI|nr:Nrap-domain-containing protein [Testicularia cyperi]
MPGVKRKASSSAAKSSIAPPTSATSRSKTRTIKQAKRADSVDSDNNDDFDDDEDLLTSALNGTGSAALSDPGEQDEDDDENDEDDDENTGADASSGESDIDEEEEDEEDGDGDGDDLEGNGDHVEMMSDEDMDGGFEDLEAESGNTEAISSTSANAITASSTTNGKPTKSSLYALPTHSEVQGLKETGELFKNNVFKLKIDEMLPEIRPNYAKAGALELVLRRLHQLFGSLEPIPSAQVGDAIRKFQSRTKGKIQIPFPEPAPKPDGHYELGFEKPSGMHLVGSWPLKTTAKRPHGMDVDVAVVMPSSLFQERDHVNFRYFHKKAFYLAALAEAISNASTAYGIQLGVTAAFALMDADPRRPILVLTPVHDRAETDFSKLKVTIRLHPTLEGDLFRPSRLGPMRNNVRVGSTAADANDANSSSSIPTPRYNAAILADTLHLPHLVYLHTTAQACPGFADACLMLKTWAFQRGFGSGARVHKRAGGETHRRLVAGTASVRFLLTMMLAHLLNGEEKSQNGGWKRDPSAVRSKLANGFSSYQLFRGVMDWLSKHDFKASPAFMKSMPSAGLVSQAEHVPRADFVKVFDRVLVDPSGTLNLLAFLPSGSVDLLQHEARRTFEMLSDTTSDHFDALFLQDRNAAPFTFDEVAKLDLPLSSKQQKQAATDAPGASAASATLRIDFGNVFQATLTQVSSTASRALQGRAKLVSLLHPSSGGLLDAWSLDAARPAPLTEAEIGVVLDAEQAWRMVEHGPSSQETDKADEFRAFWGKLSELRRFKDGRVLESVVWPVTTQASRFAIPRRILSYALYRHHAIHESQISYVSNKFDSLLSIDDSLARRAHLVSTEDKGFNLVQSAFEQLSKDLRALESLPLSIISVAPCSPGLRGTSTFVPAPLDLEQFGRKIPDVASYLPVHEMVITFEGSGKWPNDLTAMQAMKAALFERMCAEISNKIEGARCRVVFDASATSKMEDKCSLDIVLTSGFAFRARVVQIRERVLLERILADRFESTGAKRRAKKILEDWQRKFEAAPLHHSYISSMNVRFPSFGSAVRLTKRWIASQMLASPAVPEELIELVCAAAYLSPQEGAPASAVAGFLRTLRLLANWRWKEEPLMVPIQAVIDASDAKPIYTFPSELRAQVESNFAAARGSDPSMTHRAWFIATETDLEGLTYGRLGPVGGVADGIKRLAKAAAAILEEATWLSADEIRQLFSPSLAHYDFLIYLKPEVLSRYSENVEADPAIWGSKRAKYVNLEASEPAEIRQSVLGNQARPGFDAGEAFLTLLRSLYSDSFRLFHDVHGGTVIGGLFNPSLDRSRDFKVGLGFNSCLGAAEAATPVSQTSNQDGRHVMLNKAALMAEIERLGQGLVDKVELQNQ